MKQIYMQNTVPNQIRLSIKDACGGINQLTNRALSRYAILQSPLRGRGRGEASNHPSHGWLLSLSKQGAGGKLCKGPPGRSRSPGVGDGLFPDHPPDISPDRVLNPVRAGAKTDLFPVPCEQTLNVRQLTEIILNTEKHSFNKNQGSNFLLTIKFLQS